MKLSRFICVLAGLALLAGCAQQAPNETVAATASKEARAQLVPENQRSRHFNAVNRHLDLGGTLYGYVDVDGDALKLAGNLRLLTDEIAAAQPAAAAVLKQDYAQIFRDLGLTDIKAAGLSSVPLANGRFRNRVFLYTPEGRRGLLAGLGGEPTAAFAHARLAPADADFYGECELDLPAIYSAVRAVVARVGGEAAANLMETQLQQAGAPAGLSLPDLIQRFKGRSTAILRIEERNTFSLPGREPLVLPAFSLLLRIDGIAPALAPALGRLPMLARAERGGLAVFSLKEPLPVEGLQPVLAIDGDALYFATTDAFFDECRTRAGGSLAQAPLFLQAVKSVGDTGNAISYATPRLFAQLRRLPELNAHAPVDTLRTLQLILRFTPEIDQPLVTVRTNLPDGVLISADWNRSLKQELAFATAYNPVTIGVMAAMAIPAFQKVRANSQEKAVLNNLRQLAAAADQYYLEQGVETATYDQLVGPGPDKYIKDIRPVAGENYRTLRFKLGQPLEVRMANGKPVRLDP